MSDTEPSVTADPIMRYAPNRSVLAEEVTLSDVDRAYHEWLRARRAVLDAEVTAYRAEIRYQAAARAVRRATAEEAEGEPF